MLSLIMLAETAAHGETGAIKEAFPAFDFQYFPSQLFWLAVFFSFLYFVLSRMILPKLSDTIEKRRDRMASDLDQAARLNEQALDAQKSLELSLAQARNRARETSEKARDRMQAEMSGELERVDTEMSKKLAAADTRIAALRSDAMSNVEAIATDAATAMLSRLGVNATASDVKAAVAAVKKV